MNYHVIVCNRETVVMVLLVQTTDKIWLLLCDGKGDIRRQECLPACSLLVDGGVSDRGGGTLGGKKTHLNIHLLDDQQQKQPA